MTKADQVKTFISTSFIFKLKQQSQSLWIPPNVFVSGFPRIVDSYVATGQ